MQKRQGFWSWLKSLLGGGATAPAAASSKPRRRDPATLDIQEARVLEEFQKAYRIRFNDPGLLKLALTHRSYLSVTGQGPRESNERLEFLGDSVLGLVTSEFLYRRAPDEHEGQLTKTKSLLVSKAILSRRALKMGLGRFVLMSHSEVESGGRQRLSILADAFESVLGAVYLDQGFEVSRKFVHDWLLTESDAIVSDKRHTNYKSHLQEYVQSTYRTHPVYRIRSEYGPDHSKHFMVEVMVGRRTLGEGRGNNKKEAEQAAARDALEKVEKLRSDDVAEMASEPARTPAASSTPRNEEDGEDSSRGRRGRRGGRGRSGEVAEAGSRPARVVSTIPPFAAPPEVQDDVAEDDDLEDEFDEADVHPGDDAIVEEYEADEDDIDEGDEDGDEDDEAETASEFSARRAEPAQAEAPARAPERAATPKPTPVRVTLPATPIVRSASVPSAPSLARPAAPAPVPAAPPPPQAAAAATAVPTADPAPAAPAATAPMFGRSLRPGRRSGPVVPPAAKAAPVAEPVLASTPAASESRQVDVFESREARSPAAVVDVAPPPAPRAPAPQVVDEVDPDSEARIDEMERAMESFGQRRDTPPKLVPQRPGYGRKGGRKR